MSSGPKQYQIQSLAIPTARALLAIILALSFFTTIVSIGTASSAGAGAMACCIGKPGHESGSCSTGLLKPARKPQPEPEVLCGQEPAPAKVLSTKANDAKGVVEEGGHCSLHVSSAGSVTSASRQSEPEATSATSEKPGVPVIHTLSSPCPTDCGMCSVSYARRPRPREHSNLSSLARPRLHFTGPLPPSEYPRIKPLNTKLVQLQPRAPPARLS